MSRNGHTTKRIPPSVPFDDFWREQMKDPAFEREYDALEPEFSFISQMIALRNQRGLTQKQLAEKVGTPQPSIARLERRQRGSIQFLQRIADALDCTLDIRFVPKAKATKNATKRHSVKARPERS